MKYPWTGPQEETADLRAPFWIGNFIRIAEGSNLCSYTRVKKNISGMQMINMMDTVRNIIQL